MQDLLVLLIFTVTITVIVYLHIPKETYYVTKTVNDVLVQSQYADGTVVEDVSSVSVFFPFEPFCGCKSIETKYQH